MFARGSPKILSSENILRHSEHCIQSVETFDANAGGLSSELGKRPHLSKVIWCSQAVADVQIEAHGRLPHRCAAVNQ
jgi:hypothetical protein